MWKNDSFLTIGGRMLLSGLFAALLLQGCMEKKATMVINCKEEGISITRVPLELLRKVVGIKEGGIKPPGGCDLDAAAGVSAEGFVGVGGANPVPAGNTCIDGATCANPGAPGCSTRYPNKVCNSHFNYGDQMCWCQCVNP